MRKILGVFILLSLNQYLCIAQKDTLSLQRNYKMNISISGGRAIPFGGFSEFENENTPYITQGGNIAGAASNGYYGKINLDYLISSHFGISAMLYSSINKGVDLSNDEFQPPYSGGLGAGFRITSYSYDTKNWISSGALVGVCTESKLRKTSLIFKLLVGIQQVKSPETSIFMEGYNWIMDQGITSYFNSELKQPCMISYNIVGNIGLEGSYSISKKMKAKIGVESFLSQAMFDGSKVWSTNYKYTNGTTEYSERKNEFRFTKNVFIFCTNIGISYLIN